ncbi:hypothetical protein TNCV_3128241 [Trichonephila clavipes]|nr:hypothetical protein TNCV_3128241 [Trichonephila clavipes]
MESFFIGDPGRAKRKKAVMMPSIHHKGNQAVRHMMQLSRQQDDTIHKAVTHERRNPQTRRTLIDATAHTFATNMVLFVCLFIESLVWG